MFALIEEDLLASRVLERECAVSLVRDHVAS